MELEAAKTPAGAQALVFLPYLMGERSPVWDAKASGAYIGLSLFHTKAHMYRAVLEGLAFALRHNMERGQQGAVRLDPELIVVGGAAASDLWMQIIADITGYPVLTIEQEVEAPLGAPCWQRWPWARSTIWPKFATGEPCARVRNRMLGTRPPTT